MNSCEELPVVGQRAARLEPQSATPRRGGMDRSVGTADRTVTGRSVQGEVGGPAARRKESRPRTTDEAGSRGARDTRMLQAARARGRGQDVATATAVSGQTSEGPFEEEGAGAADGALAVEVHSPVIRQFTANRAGSGVYAGAAGISSTCSRPAQQRLPGLWCFRSGPTRSFLRTGPGCGKRRRACRRQTPDQSG